uniref:Uncharacterized protein n=1 Tax=Trieres chinensis TaxID=1514140 RepID=A0A7S2EAE5_TRICV|mmetsp:Transcript_14869/g.30438  ORF Transcript_14869/g.30438 Transcript_14869/m.30438 type:complete len:113 (+) Transcript_14869:158-496(+)
MRRSLYLCEGERGGQDSSTLACNLDGKTAHPQWCYQISPPSPFSSSLNCRLSRTCFGFSLLGIARQLDECGRSTVTWRVGVADGPLLWQTTPSSSSFVPNYLEVKRPGEGHR